MPVDITVHYNPPHCPLSLSTIRKRAQWLLSQMGKEEYSVSILLADDDEISWLNSHYRNKQGPTNVLSFPMAEGADATLCDIPIRELGDIIISLDTAIREAAELNQTVLYRFTWLLTHGLLHLLGYDHEQSEQEAERMFAKEQELLDRIEYLRRQPMTQLAINVDHVSTVRQARGTTEPDPVTAAAMCELAGAAGIVVHLREDRRHIQDRDVRILRETVQTKLNLEMGAAKEIITFALDTKPDMVTLVPEKRAELTTEGGLDVAGQKKKLAKTIAKMNSKDIPVSLFIDPDPKQIKASLDVGATFVEIHTGRYSDAESETERDLEFQLIESAALEAFQMGLRVNAGHGLDYTNTARVAALDTVEELSIGHAVIARAVFVGIDQAVREMLAIVQQAQLSFS
jgi:pyridoxine 5-phosphate synthase